MISHLMTGRTEITNSTVLFWKTIKMIYIKTLLAWLIRKSLKKKFLLIMLIRCYFQKCLRGFKSGCKKVIVIMRFVISRPCKILHEAFYLESFWKRIKLTIASWEKMLTRLILSFQVSLFSIIHRVHELW